MKMMKLLSVLLLGLLLGTGLCSAASVGIKNHPTVAVLPFENKGIVSKEWNREELNQVHDIAIAELQGTREFEVLERARLKALTDEMSLGMTRLVDPSTAAQVGNLTGAQYLLLGSINSVTTRRSTTSVVGAGTKRAKVTATVSMRIVDVETGRIVLAALGRGVERNTLVKAPLGIIRIGTNDVDKQQVEDALEVAINDAIHGPRGLINRLHGNVQVKKKH